MAGPLYRFSRNLTITDENQLRLGIRHDDALQGVSRELLDSIETIEKHKQALAELIDSASSCLKAKDKDGYAAMVKKIQAHASRVYVDG